MKPCSSSCRRQGEAVVHRLTAACIASSMLALAACGPGDGSAGDAAESAAAAALRVPAPATADTQGDGADTDAADGAALASALLGGIGAVITGTGECVQLANAAQRGGPKRSASVLDSARIPIVTGLRITYAVAKQDRDYENWVEVTGTDEQGFDLSIHWPEDRETARRRVLWADLDAARCFAVNYTGEPSVGGPGLTWLSLSRALLAELRGGGEVEFGLANESVPQTKRFVTFVGPLRHVRAGSFTLTLDDSLVQVPSIVARAEVRHGDAEKQFDFEFLDDPALPLLLRGCCERSSDHVVRIERRRERRIEQALAETGQAIVYGIQFDFNSAELRDDSAPVLEEIADALRAHPDWHLRVEGHTDAIGDAESNRELSQRRAAAVRDELVRRLGSEVADRLGTGGFGESRPRADNETLEGRAANRRVELIRASS